MASRKQRAWNVPGFGLPLRWPEMQSRRWQPMVQSDENILLASALDCTENPEYCYTRRELTVIALINELTDKEGWERFVFDNDATFKWKEETLMSGRDITRAMVDWSVEEAKYYASKCSKSGIIPAVDNGVFKSDSIVSSSLQLSIQQVADSLRAESASPSHGKQSEPMNQQTRDLLDPYLYPFIWERTNVIREDWSPPVTRQDCLSRIGEGREVKMPPEDDCRQDNPARYPNEMAWSRRFQWLCFDVCFDGEGAVRIPSYIPNLHPTKHASAYPVIESLIENLIPCFNTLIPHIKFPGHINQRLHLAKIDRDPIIQYDFDPSFRPPEQRAYREYLDASGNFNKEISVDLKKEFWNCGIQCVLQMQEIRVSPSSTKDGNHNDNGEADNEEEEWSITGQNNERICATAAYIYSTHNISFPTSPSQPQPCISFRAAINPDEALLAAGEFPPSSPSQPSISEIYGAQHGSPALQTLGHVTLREGRVVTWPNTFQTRLEGLSLEDEGKEGWVRVLKVHLLDPGRRGMGTGMVGWQGGEGEGDGKGGKEDGEGEGNGGIGSEEAERLREEFLEERAEFERRQRKAMREWREWDFVLE